MCGDQLGGSVPGRIESLVEGGSSGGTEIHTRRKEDTWIEHARHCFKASSVSAMEWITGIVESPCEHPTLTDAPFAEDSARSSTEKAAKVGYNKRHARLRGMDCV